MPGIYIDEARSWLQYAESLKGTENIYAKFIISYIAFLVYASKNELYDQKFEISISRTEKKYLGKFSNLPPESNTMRAIEAWRVYFLTPGVKPLKYPSYKSREMVRELHDESHLGDLGNAINFVIKVRNNVIHGGKVYSVENDRDYKVTNLALNIIEGLFKDLFND